MEKIQQAAQQVPDIKAGVGLVSAGGIGSLAQAITEWANMFIAFGNAILVLGGVYLMYHKIFNKRRDRQETD